MGYEPKREISTLEFFMRHVMPSLILASTTVLLFIAVALSAVIEYSVLSGIFGDVGESVLFSNRYTAALIVVVLEGSKVVLHLYLGKNKIQPLSFLNFVRVVLFSISLACSFVWATNTLFTDVVVDRTEMISTINEEYQQKVDALNSSVESRTAQMLEPYLTQADFANEMYSNYVLVLEPKVVYERSLEEQEQLRINAEEARIAYESAAVTLRPSVEAEIEQQVLSLVEEWECLITETEAEYFGGGNPYLTVVLDTLGKYLLGVSQYSSTAYFAVVVGLSLILAVLLEALIIFHMNLLLLEQSEWDIMVPKGDLPRGLKACLDGVVKAFTIGSVSAVVFMFVTALMSQSPADSFEGFLWIVLLFGITSTLLSGGAIRNKLALVTTSDDSIGVNFLAKVKSIAVTGGVNFAGLVILGMVFGSNFQELSVSAVGITVGSAVSDMLQNRSTT